MKTRFLSTNKKAVLCSIIYAILFTPPVFSAAAPDDKFQEWIHSYPYLGLVAEKVTYGPVTLKDFNMEGKGRLVVAKPNEVIHSSVKYKFNSDKFDSWKLHHIIVGIKNEKAAQSCISHTFGVWDQKGHADFSLKAPAEKGVYEVRFDYQNAILCNSAIKAWKEDAPSSRATVGVIIVE